MVWPLIGLHSPVDTHTYAHMGSINWTYWIIKKEKEKRYRHEVGRGICWRVAESMRGGMSRCDISSYVYMYVYIFSRIKKKLFLKIQNR